MDKFLVKRKGRDEEDTQESKKSKVTRRTILDQDESVVMYYPKVFSFDQATKYYDDLLDCIEWEDEILKFWGVERKSTRRTCVYGKKGLSYRYSGVKREAKKWPKEILEIKEKIEEVLNQEFNYVLCNYYKDGNAVIGLHSDDERDLVKGSDIASVTFGAERDFVLKNKANDETKTISLASGSLLTMGGNTQRDWRHKIPKRAKIFGGRINLTFRHIINEDK